jgi:transcriptional regulator with XRE-family HTH domain
VVGERL